VRSVGRDSDSGMRGDDGGAWGGAGGCGGVEDEEERLQHGMRVQRRSEEAGRPALGGAASAHEPATDRAHELEPLGQRWHAPPHADDPIRANNRVLAPRPASPAPVSIPDPCTSTGAPPVSHTWGGGGESHLITDLCVGDRPAVGSKEGARKRVVQEFPGKGGDELRLSLGMHLEVVETDPSGWLKGRCLASGRPLLSATPPSLPPSLLPYVACLLLLSARALANV